MKMCKEDIVRWQPDVVILIDYPGFNLSIAKYVKKNTNIPVFYYISPKIWAWKEWRIKAIKRDVKEMFSILPFEIPFYEKKHHYKIHYVGNPTKEEVDNFQHVYTESKDEFCQRNNLSSKPIIAILAGSRKQEIKDNLPSMLEAARHFEDYQMVIAAAPSIEKSYYKKYLGDSEAKMVELQTYELLTHSTAALVTSGTATLETALLNVPQVVCYETPVPKLIRFAFKHIIKVRFISLVNLIADKEIVQELLADRFSIYNIANELYRILPGQPARERMLADYQIVRERLGDAVAPDNAARIMVGKLTSSIAQVGFSVTNNSE
jgi:lipid-A-disaccharide synthetase